jgi:threonine aldolase
MPDLNPIDLRSDTVTKPTPEMRRVMANADVGDDVFGDDPTVNRLQDMVAALLGKEAALYVPSGTMANETAVRAHTRAGDEIILHAESHAYRYESGALAALAGCSVCLLHGARGLFDVEDVRAAIRPADHHYPHSALIIIENTHNIENKQDGAGGTVWPIDRIAPIRALATEAGLKMHLDGARLFNACVATGTSPADYARLFDTVSVCFSKGLGAPVGSAVAGSADVITRVHRYRKMYGGSMRQAGIIAAGAIYALEHNIERLADDHDNAKRLAVALADMPGVFIDPDTVETNIVFFEVHNNRHSAEELCDELRQRGVWMLPLGPQRVRAVTHLDVNRDQVERAIAILRDVLVDS